jgi:DNA-binding GntR family transcriptional regulator
MLAHLLLHQGETLGALAHAVGHPAEQVRVALARLARRGLVESTPSGYTVAANRRASVAGYTEGAISLRELIAAR